MKNGATSTPGNVAAARSSPRDWKTLVDAGIRLRQRDDAECTSHDATRWDYGDLAGLVKKLYGAGKLEKYSIEIGVEYERLRKYRYVASKFEKGIRIPNLSWTHHCIAATSPDRDPLLAQAQRERWSVARLRTAISRAANDRAESFDLGRTFDAAAESPRTRPGDLMLLGEHRLLCGDSTRAEDVARLMDGELAAMMWTDPPFGVNYVGKTKDALQIANDGSEGLPALLRGAWAAVSPALIGGAPFYIAHPAGPLSVEFANSVVAADWHIHQTLIWLKDAMVLGHSDYHYRHEPILYGWLPGPGRSGRGNQQGSRWFGGNAETSVFEIPRPKASPDHPTMKPVELVERQVSNSSQPGDIVLDPFLGSGTTLIAAEDTGRVCFGIEIDPVYCDVIIARWESHTELSARRVPVGQKLDESFAARDGCPRQSRARSTRRSDGDGAEQER